MARSEARLQFGCWRGGLDGHSAHAKLMYAVLLTEPTLNHAGVGAIRLARWAKEASLTIAETEQALEELGEGDLPQVIVDDDTDEVFVRTLVRNDRVAEQPYVLKGALKEAQSATSSTIRRALAVELRKLPPKRPDGESRKGGKVVYPDPHATADLIDPGPPPDPTSGTETEGSETLFDEGFTDPLERVSHEVPQKGLDRVRGRGRGGGRGSTPVGGSSEIKTARKPRTKPRQHADTPDGRARTMADWYTERNKVSSYMGVLKRIKDAQSGGHSDSAIAAALKQLLETGYPVSSNTLLVALNGSDGPQAVHQTITARAVASGDAAWDEYDRRHGINVHQLNVRSEGA